MAGLQAVAQRATPLGSRRALGTTPSFSGTWAFRGVNLLKGATSKYFGCAPPPAPETAPRRTELPRPLAKRFPRPSPDARAVCAARCRLAISLPLARAVAGRWHATIARSKPCACALPAGTAAWGDRSMGAAGSSVARGEACGAAELARCALIDVVDFRSLSRLARARGASGRAGRAQVCLVGALLGGDRLHACWGV